MEPFARYDTFLLPEPRRVVLRPFHIASEPRDLHPLQTGRMERIVRGVAELSHEECDRLLQDVAQDFGNRHRFTEKIFKKRFEEIARAVHAADALTGPQQSLAGAFFCHEYSFAAAAVMNPSIVPHPNQKDLPADSVRFVLSVRTVGEGHISSISFREGELSGDHKLTVYSHPDQTFAVDSEEIRPSEVVVARRPDGAPISGTVIFPFTPAQRNGLEDLRLVAFDDGGRTSYHGTYTAYSGRDIRSELLTTADFNTFNLSPMSGVAALNKGMALFPRRIHGAYAMIGRQDGESLYFLQSENLLHWEQGARIAEPLFPWELIQIGNCGSPIELDEGWLLLTHGVGAMRKYSIGAMLLDKQSPQRVLARAPNPILSPSLNERDGYVPNVVYTCGAMRHRDRLFMPYGVADSSVAFASIELKYLLEQLK
ncbi:MAG: glycoside hydrolase family 130 protein [Pseudomonadota bacterium]